MLKILFIGDINGKIGRKAIKAILPKLKKELKPNLVIANAENMAHGKGLTEVSIKEMIEAGVDWFTSGDHAFDREGQVEKIFEGSLPVIRPANYSKQAPGKGYALISSGKYKILLFNLIGRVFMPLDYDCPFTEAEKILNSQDLANKNLSAIIVDMHAEATSEKVALGHFLDGKVSAVIGTHTHIMTADQKITPRKTAYITDVGMVGLADGVIGIDKENIINTFLTQIKRPHILPEVGQAIFNAVLITLDSKTAKAKQIKPITKYINIT